MLGCPGLAIWMETKNCAERGRGGHRGDLLVTMLNASWDLVPRAYRAQEVVLLSPRLCVTTLQCPLFTGHQLDGGLGVGTWQPATLLMMAPSNLGPLDELEAISVGAQRSTHSRAADNQTKPE